MDLPPALAALLSKGGLSGSAAKAAQSLYERCWELLQTDSRDTISLGEGNGPAAWSPIVVWLLRSLPGLLPCDEACPVDRRPGPPLGELLDAAGVSLVLFFEELPVVLAKLRPCLTEALAVARGDVAPPEGDAAAGAEIDRMLRLREWQETLASLSSIALKYKALFGHVTAADGGSCGGSAAAQAAPLLRAGWLAFLLLKAELLPGLPDLVSCLELLVCTLAALLAAGSTFSDGQLATLRAEHPGAVGSDGRLRLLAALADTACVDAGKAETLLPRIEASMRTLLERGSFAWAPAPLPAAAAALHPQAAVLDVGCLPHLPGLAGQRQAVAELALHLEEVYQEVYVQQGEIDERSFLTADYAGLASPRAGGVSAVVGVGVGGPAPLGAAAVTAGTGMGGSSTGAGTNGAAAMASLLGHQGAAAAASPAAPTPPGGVMTIKPPLAPAGTMAQRALQLGLSSPLPLMYLGPPGPATPISSALGAVAWLRSLLRDRGAEPGPGLRRLLEAAGGDAGAALLPRVQAAAAAVFAAEDGTAGAAAGVVVQPITGAAAGALQGVLLERSSEGLQLYWSSLQSVLEAEEARAGLSAATSLLQRWSLHLCLLACAFEVVAASYRMAALSFPSVPVRLGLAPFDLVKVIGPFVKSQPGMPRELKRHMFTVEEKILESLGWAPGSSLYWLLRAATVPISAAPVTQAHAPAGAEDQQQQQQQASEGARSDSSGGAASGQAASDGASGSLRGVCTAAQAGSGRPRTNSDSGNGGGSDTDGVRKRPHTDEQAAAASPAAAAAAAAAAASSGGGGHCNADSVSTKRQRSSAGGDGAPQQQPLLSAAAPAVVPAGTPTTTAAETPPPLPQSLGALTGPVPLGADPSARAVVVDYCTKVLKLGAFRLVAISDGLDFSPLGRADVVAAAHSVLSSALSEHTHLFYGRHLDTLLLACLYGCCKVNRLQQITFREIIAHYKRQPHARQEAFRIVPLQRSDPGLAIKRSGDVIEFYNGVFVPELKPLLLATVERQAALAAARSGGGVQQGSAAEHAGGGAGALYGGGAAAGAGGPAPSPVIAALAHAAQQQQQHAAAAAQHHRGGSGGAYRALQLASGLTGGGSGSGSGMAHLHSGLLSARGGSGGLGVMDATGSGGSGGGGSRPLLPVGRGSTLLQDGDGAPLPSSNGQDHRLPVAASAALAVGSSGVAGAAAAVAAAAAAAAATALPMGVSCGAAAAKALLGGALSSGAGGSRLSRLSRPSSADSGSTVTPRAAAALDADTQQDQGLPATAAAAAMDEGTSCDGGACVSPAALATLLCGLSNSRPGSRPSSSPAAP